MKDPVLAVRGRPSGPTPCRISPAVAGPGAPGASVRRPRSPTPLASLCSGGNRRPAVCGQSRTNAGAFASQRQPSRWGLASLVLAQGDCP